MKTKFVLVICLAMLSFSYGVAQDHQKHEVQDLKSGQGAKEVYSCPMHPEIVSDKPGKCPKCGMKLEKQATKGERTPSSMMGKPTFEKSVEGISIQVWLMTQDEHKKMMNERMGKQKEQVGMKGTNHDAMHGKGMMGMMHEKKEESKDDKDHHVMEEGMKHDGKEMSMETMEAMMAGTHHVMVMATNVSTNEAIDRASIKIAVTSPSNNAETLATIST